MCVHTHVHEYTQKRKVSYVIKHACAHNERVLHEYKACQPDTMPAIWRSINELMRYRW